MQRTALSGSRFVVSATSKTKTRLSANMPSSRTRLSRILRSKTKTWVDRTGSIKRTRSTFSGNSPLIDNRRCVPSNFLATEIHQADASARLSAWSRLLSAMNCAGMTGAFLFFTLSQTGGSPGISKSTPVTPGLRNSWRRELSGRSNLIKLSQTVTTG